MKFVGVDVPVWSVIGCPQPGPELQCFPRAARPNTSIGLARRGEGGDRRAGIGGSGEHREDASRVSLSILWPNFSSEKRLFAENGKVLSSQTVKESLC